MSNNNSLVITQNIEDKLYTSPLNNDDFSWNCMQKNTETITESQTIFIFKDTKMYMFQLAYNKISLFKNVQFTLLITDILNQENHFTTFNNCKGKFNNAQDCITVENDYVKFETTLNKEETKTMKLTIKEKTEFVGQLEITFDNKMGCKLGKEGVTSIGNNDGTANRIKHSFLANGKSFGSIIKKEKVHNMDDGEAIFIHAELNNKPYAVFDACRLNLFNSQRIKFMSLSFTPHGNKKETVSQSYLFVDGNLEFVSVDEGFGFENNKSTLEYYDNVLDNENNIEFNHKNKIDNNYESITFNAALNRTHKVDVLKEIPYAIRKIIQVFVTNPYMFMYLQSATVLISPKDKQTIQSEGVLYSETSLLN